MEMETCTLGQYKARMVTVKGEQVLFVFQDDTPLYSSSLMGSTMFADGDAVADLPSPRSGAPRSLVYHADDRVSGARVMVVDRDLDGQPDLRARRYPDNRSESEVWFKDGWRAQVTRGNERGVMIEGEFTPIDEIPALQR
jgi:hypothetical protein